MWALALSLYFTCIAAQNALSRHRGLPTELLVPPSPVGELPRLASTYSDDDLSILKSQPRAVVGYVSEKEWSFIEFLCMTHASWRYITGLEGADRFKLDIYAFVHPRWAKEVSTICEPMDLNSPVVDSNRSQCFAITYPPAPEHVWQGYPFINNVHIFADHRVASLLTTNYGFLMKTDFDTFLSPMVLHLWPHAFLFGTQEYVVVPATAERLKRISSDLELEHKGWHNLGPTWYGPADQLVAMANASISVLYHIVTREFEQLPGGGIKQKWGAGEGWPEWSAGIAALYATEITANHMFGNIDHSRKLDEHGDSELSLAAVYHIHCRHGDKDFSKFEFFQHHYDHVDVTKLDIGQVRNYATWLAASTWRQLVAAQTMRAGGGSVGAAQLGQPQIAHSEL